MGVGIIRTGRRLLVGRGEGREEKGGERFVDWELVGRN